MNSFSSCKESDKDYLTGLFSYKYFVENYQDFYRNYPYGRIIAFDLTNFKSINDNHGHLVGDNCLINFASLLCGMFSEGDICVRRSGDEFLVLTDKADKEIEFILTQIINTIYTNYNEGLFDLVYGFNAGICPIEENMKISEKKADDTLYEAKKDSKSYLFFSKSLYAHVNELKEYAETIDKTISKNDIQYRTRNVFTLDNKDIGVSDIYAIDGYTKSLIHEEKLEELRKYSCLKKLDFSNLRKIITCASCPNGNKLMININGQSLVNEESNSLLYMLRALESISNYPLEKFIICINVDNMPDKMMSNLLYKISILSDMGFRIALQNYSLEAYNVWLQAKNDIDFIKIGNNVWKDGCANNNRLRKSLKTNLEMLAELKTLPIFMRVTDSYDLSIVKDFGVSNSLIIGNANGCMEQPLKLIKKQV